MLCFIYSRKSVYTAKGDSTQNQIQMCTQYIHQKLPQVCDDAIVVYEDEGFSAKNTNRPRFLQMLNDIRTQRPQYVVCYRLDRISRNVGDFSRLIDELERLGVGFISIKEEFDTSKPMGKAMLYIASVFAQLERETIAQRVRDNMLTLARSGRWLGGTAPTGYASQTLMLPQTGQKPKAVSVLQPLPQETAVVLQIFSLFLAYKSLHAVWRQLAAQGVCSRTGKAFSVWGLRQILQNPVYCQADQDAYAYFASQHANIAFAQQDCTGEYGLIAYNKRDYRQRHTPRQSVDKWVLAIGRHPGLIPGRDWVYAQTLLKRNAPAHASPLARNQYALLSGVVHCRLCGAKMTAKPRQYVKNPGTFDYICQTKLQKGAQACACSNLNGAQTDQQVFSSLASYLQTLVTPKMLWQGLQRRLQAKQKPYAPAFDSLSSPATPAASPLALPGSPPQARANASIGQNPAQPPQNTANPAGLPVFLPPAPDSGCPAAGTHHAQTKPPAALPAEAPPCVGKPAAPPASACALPGCPLAGASGLPLQDVASMLCALNLFQKRALVALAIRRITWDGTTLRLFCEDTPTAFTGAPAPDV